MSLSTVIMGINATVVMALGLVKFQEGNTSGIFGGLVITLIGVYIGLLAFSSYQADIHEEKRHVRDD
jgi:hypothetical protein